MTPERAKEILALAPYIDPKNGTGITPAERNELWNFYKNNIHKFTFRTDFFYILRLIAQGEI